MMMSHDDYTFAVLVGHRHFCVQICHFCIFCVTICHFLHFCTKITLSCYIVLQSPSSISSNHATLCLNHATFCPSEIMPLFGMIGRASCHFRVNHASCHSCVKVWCGRAAEALVCLPTGGSFDILPTRYCRRHILRREAPRLVHSPISS